MYFGIYDYRTIQSLKPKADNAVLIRILEPSWEISGCPYVIKNIEDYNNVLELYFHDITNSQIQLPNTAIGFSKDLAKKLNHFILENDFDEIAIHCSAGISRSPAIGLCVSKILQNKEMEDMILSYSHFIPNKQILEIFNSFNYITKPFNGKMIFRNLEFGEFKMPDLKREENGYLILPF